MNSIIDYGLYTILRILIWWALWSLVDYAAKYIHDHYGYNYLFIYVATLIISFPIIILCYNKNMVNY